MKRQKENLKPWERPRAWWGTESFGGLPKGRSAKTNPKKSRPLSVKYAVHLVMKSEHAVGARSFRHPRNYVFVQERIGGLARKYGLKIHRRANSGNHLHILLSAPTREALIRFMRRLAAVLACRLMGGKKGEPRDQFWTGRPFTRVVNGGKKAFWRAESYVILNELEAAGVLPARSMARLGARGNGDRMRLLRLARLIDGEER